MSICLECLQNIFHATLQHKLKIERKVGATFVKPLLNQIFNVNSIEFKRLNIK